jgi:hypothetical protein
MLQNGNGLPMNTRISPPIRIFIPATVVLMILGWGGLVAVLAFSSPNGGTRWAFFFSAVLALTGTVLPGIAYLNRRFPSSPPPTPAAVVRQALWVGIYFPILAWLQIGRVLTPAMALLLAVGFILIEWLLRLRERAQWKP